MKERIQLLATVTLTVIGIALSPKAQAVVPPPDGEGKPYTVRYDQVNAMLLNEFLKARRQIDAPAKANRCAY